MYGMFLRSIQDIMERNCPPTLLTDAPRMREVLQHLIERNSLYCCVKQAHFGVIK